MNEFTMKTTGEAMKAAGPRDKTRVVTDAATAEIGDAESHAPDAGIAAKSANQLMRRCL